MISREEFKEWQNSKCTQEMYSHVLQEVEFNVQELIGRPTDNPNHNRDYFLRGIIRAMDEVITWEPKYAPEVDLDKEFDDHEV